MKKFIFYSLIIFNFISTSATGATSNEIALSLIQKYGFGRNLTNISYQAAMQTQTYKMIVNKVGEKKAESAVKGEIDKLLPSYQSQWNKNLAASYSQVISAEKLQSLLNEGPSSKYADELKAKQGEIGTLMQSKSTGLLNEFITKAMDSALKRSKAK
jgi:hypothetical protein